MGQIKDNGLILGIASSLVASALLIGIKIVLGESIAASDFVILVVASTALVVGAVAIAPRVIRGARSAHLETIKAKFHRDFRIELEQKTGLVRVFKNFTEAKAEIIEQIRTSKKQYYFLQMGKTIMSGNDMIGENLTEKPLPDDHDIRILHASLRNPHLSESAARARKINYQKWLNEFKYFRDKAPLFQLRNIKVRQHMEGFIWRFFVFDNCCYVQPYFFARSNDERAPIYKLSRYHSEAMREGFAPDENEMSLYRTFESFFSLKWDENAPPAFSLRRLVEQREIVSATAVLRLNDLFVFVVPMRFLTEGNGEVRFHGVGGKVAESELIVDALRREAQEELSCPIEIVDSPMTLSASAGSQREVVEVQDRPRPLFVYKRPNRSDRILEEGHSHIVAFAARLDTNSRLKPSSEIHSILVLSRELLARAMRGEVTYADIDSSSDGSRIVSDKKAELLNKRAAPSGLAEFIIEIGWHE